MPSVSLFLFFFSSKCSISNHYRAIIPPTPNFLWFSAPEQVFFFSFFFFISQRREFESQPTQTTFTVWQMKLINNLKHALAEAHTIMSLNMFLHAAEMHLNRSPVVHIKGKHNSCCSFTSPYISIISHTPVYTQLRYPLCEASDADSTCRNRLRSICKKRTAGCFSQTWSGWSVKTSMEF